MALKSTYMMSESQIYITNIDLLLSSRLGYPTADQHLKPNVPHLELQMALSLKVFSHLCKFVSIQLFRPKCGSHPWCLSFTAHMQVISKSNGTNNIQNPTTSSHLHCYFSPAVYSQHSCQNDSANATPCSKSLVTSCLSQRVLVIVIASQLQIHPSILDLV